MTGTVQSIPQHVAIIPDGNRRWAKAHGCKRWEGHQEGFKRFEEILEAAFDIGVKYLTAWALSLDNFSRRPKDELAFLFRAFEKYFAKLGRDRRIWKYGVHVEFIGAWRERLPKRLVAVMEETMAKTKAFKDRFLTICICYDGKEEMLRAIDTIRTLPVNPHPTPMTPQLVKAHLATKDLPPVDLLIRTGGEPHLSAGFLMWDTADAECYFSAKHWPDFTKEEFLKALRDYASRSRRFGA